MTTEVKYTGTIFQGWAVRAIQEGRKTNTRRLNGLAKVNKQPDEWEYQGLNVYGQHLFYPKGEDYPDEWDGLVRCPYGQVGDRLWVRETHYRWGRWVPNGLSKTGKQKWTFKAGTFEVLYMDNPPTLNVLRNSNRMERGWFKRPAIFMPRWASRITLEITGVKVERIQEITHEDAEDEGIDFDTPLNDYGTGSIVKDTFAALWDSINAKRGFGWDVNPWDLALTFKVVNGKP